MLKQAYNKGIQSFKNEKGAALVTALLVMLVLTLLGTVIAFTAATEGRQSVRYSDKAQAYHLARASAEAASEKVIKNYDPDEDDIIDYINEISADFAVENGQVTNIEGIDQDELIFLDATAEYNGVEETVRLQLVGGGGTTIFDYAIFSTSEEDDQFKAHENLSVWEEELDVKGLIGAAGTINFLQEEAKDNLKYEENVDTTEPFLPDFDETRFPEKNGPEPIDSLEIVSEDYYEEISTTGNREIVIDTSDAENSEDGFFIRVDGVNRANITIKGGNILHMLVHNKFDMRGNESITFDDDKKDKLIIYILDGSDIDLSGTPGANNYIYAPYSEINFAGGAQFNMYGGIVAKEFNSPAAGNANFFHDPGLLKKGAFTQTSLDELEKKSTGLARGAWLD